MAKETFHQHMLEEMSDIYDAEHQITQMLPKMIKAATSKELISRFETHLKETENQIKRMEKAFEVLGEKAERKTCKAMKGIVAEGEEVIKEHQKSPVLDAALVSSAQRVEHYEIAAYGSVRAYAEAMGHKEVVALFSETLAEEKHADKLLTETGEKINHECASDPKLSGMSGR